MMRTDLFREFHRPAQPVTSGCEVPGPGRPRCRWTYFCLRRLSHRINHTPRSHPPCNVAGDVADERPTCRSQWLARGAVRWKPC